MPEQEYFSEIIREIAIKHVTNFDVHRRLHKSIALLIEPRTNIRLIEFRDELEKAMILTGQMHMKDRIELDSLIHFLLDCFKHYREAMWNQEVAEEKNVEHRD